MNESLQSKKILWGLTVDIWKKLCELHNDLYELTYHEYLLLLESNINDLESTILEKENIILKIQSLDKDRVDLIRKINDSYYPKQKIDSVSDLMLFFKDIDEASPIPALKNLSSLLLETITKTQSQNKKNQVFLNKAIQSIQDLKSGLNGKKQYSTYGADGQTRALHR